MRRLMAIGWALALLLGSARTTHAIVVPLDQPASVGSQLLFYYDTREGFTTFANLGQVGLEPVTVRIEFYGPTFGVTTAVQTYILGPLETRVIDVGALKATLGLAAQQGIAVASVVNDASEPINVPSLSGNFTVANLATGSAWGSPAPARSARFEFDGSTVPVGIVVDGNTVAYQSFQPPRLTLAAYYDPRTLAPVSAHGNQVIFVSLKNAATKGAFVTPGSTTWEIDGAGHDGGPPIFTTVTVSGVTEFDLISLVGEAANGAAGGLLFSSSDTPIGESRLVFFVQSLGTFGTGYLLPPVPRVF